MKWQVLIVIAALTVLLDGCHREKSGEEAVEEGESASEIPSARSHGSLPESELGAAETSAKLKVRPLKPDGPPIGKPVEGKLGYVINPKTRNEVFVGGLKPGTLLKDPEFPEDEACYFLVPAMEMEENGPPVAREVPGKSGFIFSPFNNLLIDVGGIPAGTLVLDPTYPAEEGKTLRVPVSKEMIVEVPEE